MYNALLYEDNLVLQEHLVELLQDSGQLNICVAHSNASTIVADYEQYSPHLVISDIDMPITNGLEALVQLKNKFPEAKVLILTVFEDNDNVLNAICNGANGYILKSSPTEKIIEAAIDVINGGSALTPIIANKILQHFPKPKIAKHSSELDSLSEKEKEVLNLLTKGYSYKMIAAALDKSIETVKVQIKNIYKKLHVQSNGEAIRKALGG
jgi:DNA-binding NarL/FixJ family response regulator